MFSREEKEVVIFNDRGKEVAGIIEIPSPEYRSIEEELLSALLNR